MNCLLLLDELEQGIDLISSLSISGDHIHHLPVVQIEMTAHVRQIFPVGREDKIFI